MRTRSGNDNNKGTKRERIASNCQDVIPQDGHCRKRIRGGSDSDSWMEKKDFFEDDSDTLNTFNPGRLYDDDSLKCRDHFDMLPDDVIISILGKVSAVASSPTDLINVLLVNKRLSVLGLDREVLEKAAGKSLWLHANSWSGSAHQFLARCANSGNLEACHFLGMIEFYCLANHARGIELLRKAAEGSHAGALYSLAIVYFNGSGSLEGGLRCQRDPDSAASLCLKSACLGNIDALREVAYCFQRGLGFPCSPTVAHRLLVRANTLELIKTNSKLIETNSSSDPLYSPNNQRVRKDSSLLTNYGFYETMGKEVHAANKFMVEWWWLARGGENREDGLNMCSNVLCGRRETRPGGFRKCASCGIMIYCSHGCQEMHWRMEHGCSCFRQNMPMNLA